MKSPLTSSLLLILAACRVLGAPEPFYVAAHDGIFRGEIDSETGALTPLMLVAPTHQPGFLAQSPTQPTLYATYAHSVGAFLLNADGKASALNESETGGQGACHVAVDRSGRYVFIADYGAGRLITFGIKPDGSLTEKLSQIQLHGSGPNKKRQDHSYAHSIYPDLKNRFLYACDLGSDHIWIFKFDAKTGALTPSDPPSAEVPPGSGPRHLAFSPDGRFVYVANEMGGSVTVFARDAAMGALHRLETVSTLPADSTIKDIWSAEIVCHPTGKWLYVSNRGGDTICVFTLASNGKATLIQNAPSLVKQTRSFWLDPLGKWLVAAGEKGNQIAVLKIDPVIGKLSPTDQIKSVTGPECVLFEDAKK